MPTKFLDTDVVFQEIPNEVSLAITITNCQNKCLGCHSPYLRKDVGKDLLVELPGLMKKYKGLISTILLLGEGNDKKGLMEILLKIRLEGFKTALYSGSDDIDREFLPLLDFYKIGSYRQELGGLGSPNSNQKLYKVVRQDLIEIKIK